MMAFATAYGYNRASHSFEPAPQLFVSCALNPGIGLYHYLIRLEVN